MARKIAEILSVLFLSAVLMTGCGNDNAIVGKWILSEIEAQGERVSVEDFMQSSGTEISLSFDFTSDGNVTADINGIVVEGVYTQSGSSIAVTLDGETQTMTLEGGNLTMPQAVYKVFLKKQ